MEQKKKIAFVANSGFNLYNFRFSLMKKFKEDGYTIIGICPEDAYCELLMKEGFEIIFLHNLQRKGSNPISDYKLYRELYSIYKAHNIDVVLQYTIKPNIYGTLAAKKLAIRIICNITGLGYTFINKGLVSAISKVLYKLSFRKADHVVFQNIQDARLFIEKKYVDAGKTSICNGSGIDVNKYTPIPKIQDDKVHFLFVGRLLKIKASWNS